MDSRINLNTTVWLFTRDTGEVHQVIDQYRDTYEALGSAYRVMKKALEGQPYYIIFTVAITLDVLGSPRNGIGIMSDSSELALFIPDAELEGEVEPFLMVNGEMRPLSAVENN